MSARDDYPHLATYAVEAGFDSIGIEATDALDEIDALRAVTTGVSQLAEIAPPSEAPFRMDVTVDVADVLRQCVTTTVALQYLAGVAETFGRFVEVAS